MSGSKSETFKWTNGLIQGCALSPLLFVMTLNYIFKYLEKEYLDKCGYDLGTRKILLTAYIDDICIICNDTTTLSLVYKTLIELFDMMGLSLNKSKCALMTINTDVIHDDLKDIALVKTFKYLGEYISSDGTCTESYRQFLTNVTHKLICVDKKNIPKEKKSDIFGSTIVPWINRKTMAMYDIDKVRRLKMVAIIKPFIEKWEPNAEIKIFSDIKEILEASTDDIINNVKFTDEEFDKELEEDIDLSNYVMKNMNIKLLYSEINENFTVEEQLEQLDAEVD